MDVRCERCRAQYVFDDDQVTATGLAVQCTNCGHVFKVKKKELVVTVPVKPDELHGAPLPATAAAPKPAGAAPAGASGAPTPGHTLAPAPPPAASSPSEWRVRQANGNLFTFRELTTLQKWIIEQKVGRDDEISHGGDQWKRLGNIPDLAGFFQVVEAAERGRAAAAHPAVTPIPVPYPVAVPGYPTPAPGYPFPLGAGTTPVPFGVPAPAAAPAPTASPVPAAEPSRRGDDLDLRAERRPGRREPRRRRGGTALLLGFLLVAVAATGVVVLHPEWIGLAPEPPARAIEEPAAHDAAAPIAPATAAPAPVPAPPGAADPATQAAAAPATQAAPAPAAQAAAPEGSPAAAPAPPAASAAQHPPDPAASAAAAVATAPAAVAGPTPAGAPPPASTDAKPPAAPDAKPPAPSSAAAAPASAPVPPPDKADPAPPRAPEVVAKPEAAAPPKPAPAAAKGPKALLAEASRLRERGAASRALDVYGKVVAAQPRNADALAGRGLCYLDLSQYGPAEASFLAALEADPEQGDALLGLAESYRWQGRKADAIKYYDRYLAFHPDGDEAAVARNAISQLKE